MANTTWSGSDKLNVTLSGGNLIATSSGSGGTVRAIDKQVSGKFYWECTFVSTASNATGVGIMSSSVPLTNLGFTTAIAGMCGVVRNTGAIFIDGVQQSATFNLGTIANGTVICMAVDCDARLMWFRAGAAGNWNNVASANPVTGVGGMAVNSLGRGIPLFPTAVVFAIPDQVTANFGDTAFVGAVPSGYTSGFTAGASVPTNALASQALAEHWLTTDPQAQITQVLVEHWQSVASGNLQAVVTQVLIEHWMSVASVSPASGGPQVTMIH